MRKFRDGLHERGGRGVSTESSVVAPPVSCFNDQHCANTTMCVAASLCQELACAADSRKSLASIPSIPFVREEQEEWKEYASGR